jgi:hypothetical protein
MAADRHGRTKEGTDMDQIESILQRPKLYNNIDGVGELGLGLMLLGFALLSWLQARSPAGAIWHRMDVFVVWVGLMLLGIQYGSKAIKTHITYPRTGFVEYRRRDSTGTAAIAFVVAALVAAGIGFAARLLHLRLTTPVADFGLAFAVAYAFGIARAVRWKWGVVGAIAVCSVAVAMLPEHMLGAVAGDASAVGGISGVTAGAWLLSILVYGAIMLVSGGISFVLYLRHTQPPAQAVA